MHPSLPLIALLACSSAFAQNPKTILFGDGRRPHFQEDSLDRNFQRSRLARALNEGTADENCKVLLGGLLTALAETAPFLHNRDENLYFEPNLWAAIQTQLDTPTFPSSSYLLCMVRHVLIQKRMPEAWLKTAQTINSSYHIIDLDKLKLLSEGLSPIDSFLLSLPMLKQRFDEEVLAVNSTSKTHALVEFKDTYLDREVTFSGLLLDDISLYSSKTKKKQKQPRNTSNGELVAVFSWVLPGQTPNAPTFGFVKKQKLKTIRVQASLAPRQYINLERIPKGARLMVKGRLWSVNAALTEIEIINALLFVDKEWSAATLLALPGMVDKCPFAVNDLTGVAPVQPGGFNRIKNNEGK
ncbi:MAG: hypothetical protein FWC28_02625 [Proteobacteria bacterium]|nr:hypothetical protein [Cystobacterineae bacterium]MCL2259420.1 hypothetical protein [Cystobacterineae bacterium]MCL2314133.1 hypothetical protein [Pseudomonadota bacterium]